MKPCPLSCLQPNHRRSVGCGTPEEKEESGSHMPIIDEEPVESFAIIDPI